MNTGRRPAGWRFMMLIAGGFTLARLVDANSNDDKQHPRICYFPSGGIGFGAPCNPEAENSACCPFGFGCLTNGLCKTTAGNEKNFKHRYYRSSCTDHSWNSSLCNQSCRDDEFDNTDSGTGLELCDESRGIYCCAREFNCCSNSASLLYLGAPNITKTLARPTELPGPRKQQGTNKDTVVGVAVGFSIAAVVFLLVWVFWIWRRRRLARKALPAKARGNAAELDAMETSSAITNKNETHVTQTEVVELESPIASARSELDGTMMPSPATLRNLTWTSGSLSSGTDMASLGTLITPEIVELEGEASSNTRTTRSAEKGSASAAVSPPPPAAKRLQR